MYPSRLRVNPLRLTPEDVRIEDIAHHLALINRFNGGTPKPISVAQHSVLVSRLLPDEHALAGLLHDASEAYLGDVTKWLKMSDAMTAYREAEAWAQRVIFGVFGCPLEQHPDIDDVDRLMVRYEAWKSGITIDVPGYEPPNKEECKLSGWKPWSWQYAEELFMATFRSLTI